MDTHTLTNAFIIHRNVLIYYDKALADCLRCLLKAAISMQAASNHHRQAVVDLTSLLILFVCFLGLV